jgi:hypothetical protein
MPMSERHTQPMRLGELPTLCGLEMGAGDFEVH